MSELLDRYEPNARIHAVITAVAAGELSEGQAKQIIGWERIELRKMSQEHLTVAEQLWKRYSETKRTIGDDIRDAVRVEGVYYD